MRYIISEERLLELLEAEDRLHCLERDGVDNWSWYMEGRTEFIAQAMGIDIEDVVNNDFDFADLARYDIGAYEAVKEE